MAIELRDELLKLWQELQMDASDAGHFAYNWEAPQEEAKFHKGHASEWISHHSASSLQARLVAKVLCPIRSLRLCHANIQPLRHCNFMTKRKLTSKQSYEVDSTSGKLSCTRSIIIFHADINKFEFNKYTTDWIPSPSVIPLLQTDIPSEWLNNSF